jgi:hypothetical protein
MATDLGMSAPAPSPFLSSKTLSYESNQPYKKNTLILASNKAVRNRRCASCIGGLCRPNANVYIKCALSFANEVKLYLDQQGSQLAVMDSQSSHHLHPTHQTRRQSPLVGSAPTRKHRIHELANAFSTEPNHASTWWQQ